MAVLLPSALPWSPGLPVSPSPLAVLPPFSFLPLYSAAALAFLGSGFGASVLVLSDVFSFGVAFATVGASSISWVKMGLAVGLTGVDISILLSLISSAAEVVFDAFTSSSGCTSPNPSSEVPKLTSIPFPPVSGKGGMGVLNTTNIKSKNSKP